MDGSTIAIALRGVHQLGQRSDSIAGREHWFSNIPPERIGLHGEYDYYGLSKRVSRCLSAHGDSALQQLKVRQRGRVVVLRGQVNSPHVLDQAVALALSVDGVDEVEAYGVTVVEAC